MADDNNNGTEITNEAARGALAVGLAASLSGNGAAVRPLKAGAVVPTPEVITPAEARTWREWAEKSPQLIRQAAQNGQLGDLGDLPHVSSPFTYPLIGLGVVAGIASFTRLLPGNWKWVGRIGAIAAVSGGLTLGKKAADMNRAMPVVASGVKEMCLDYAAMLDRDPAVRAQLAAYLGAEMTADYVAPRPLEEAVAGKAIEFGQARGYLGENVHCPHCR